MDAAAPLSGLRELWPEGKLCLSATSPDTIMPRLTLKPSSRISLLVLVQIATVERPNTGWSAAPARGRHRAMRSGRGLPTDIYALAAVVEQCESNYLDYLRDNTGHSVRHEQPCRERMSHRLHVVKRGRTNDGVVGVPSRTRSQVAEGNEDK
jgi:hypothetical protein